MAEKLKNNQENLEVDKSLVSKQQEKIMHDLEKKAKESKHEHAEKLNAIRQEIDKSAKAKEEHQAKAEKEVSRPSFINKELKDITYRRTLKKTQNKLPTPYKALSRVIHQPVIEAVSEVAGKTIARPSGVLMGGIFAFLGSSLFLWVSKHYGYEYNFLIFLAFFSGGFLIGALVEFGLYLATRKTK